MLVTLLMFYDSCYYDTEELITSLNCILISALKEIKIVFFGKKSSDSFRGSSKKTRLKYILRTCFEPKKILSKSCPELSIRYSVFQPVKFITGYLISNWHK